MSGHSGPSRTDTRETVRELRRHLGLFSFQDDVPTAESVVRNSSSPELGVRPGGIVEWLVAKPGAGAVTSALQITARSSGGRGVWAVVDPARECYVPALSGWGIDPGRTLLLRPATLRGNVLGDRAMPALSRSVGHVGMGRRADPRASSSPLEIGGGSGRRRGLVLPADRSAAGTRLGRLTSAGHAPGREARGKPDG